MYVYVICSPNGKLPRPKNTQTRYHAGYTSISFTVDGAELLEISSYLYEAKRMQLKFDAMGMYLAALPFQINPFATGGKKTFCSKHVTKALKAAGIEGVSSLNENIVTPSKLYRVLKERLDKDRMVMGTVAHRQKALMESGTVFSIS